MFIKKCTCCKTKDISIFDFANGMIFDGYKMENGTLGEWSSLLYVENTECRLMDFSRKCVIKIMLFILYIKVILIYHHLLVEGSEKIRVLKKIHDAPYFLFLRFDRNRKINQ